MYLVRNNLEFFVKKSVNTIFSALAVALVLLTGCAQTKVSAPQEVKKELRSLAKIESLGGGFQVSGGVSAAQSRVVFYRAAQSALTGATSLFLDGRYHASLEPGAWSALCYKTGLVEMGARQMLVGSQPKDLPDTITAMSLMPGQTHYVRVQQSADKPVLQPVAAAQAVQELAGTRQQIHTISRVEQVCQEGVAPAIAPAPVTERITLPADTLFAFDRSDQQAMTGAGVKAIDRLLARIRTDFSRIDHLHVIGHADPLGQVDRNEKLAQDRAQTVRDYIVSKDLPNLRITTEGRGSSEPVVTTCGRKATPASIACNLPNRRVVVVVTGQRR
jgi:outer membrane protein OmpA-like peptidoglycan-associated protein